MRNTILCQLLSAFCTVYKTALDAGMHFSSLLLVVASVVASVVDLSGVAALSATEPGISTIRLPHLLFSRPKNAFSDETDSEGASCQKKREMPLFTKIIIIQVTVGPKARNTTGIGAGPAGLFAPSLLANA